MTRVKVCGLTRESDVAVAIEGGADLLGFVHVHTSPRFVAADRLASLLALVPKGVLRVVVVQNLDLEALDRLRESLEFDYFQFHGRESPHLVRQFRGYKVFHVRNNEDLSPDIEPLDPFYLLDTQTGSRQGGTGNSFDWSVLPRMPGRFFVAGGLHSGNVGELIRRYRPFGIDVSSGIESEPGVKDPHKLTDFLNHARSASQP